MQDGLFDIGITGQDWIAETAADVEVLATLSYAKSGTGHGTRVVLAVPNEHVANSAREIPPGTRISTEFMHLTERYFADLGIDVKVVWSFGATEAKVPEIVDAIVDITETGSTLRAHGMKIIETLLESEPVLVANRQAAADPSKRAAMDDVTTLLLGALRAEEPGPHQAERHGDGARQGAGGRSLDEGADGVAALRRGIRDRDRGREATRQHADPAAEGGRRHGHPGAPHLQDRSVTGAEPTARAPDRITSDHAPHGARHLDDDRLATVAGAEPGRLDTFFSHDGIQTAFPNGGVAYAVAIDHHDRIVVAGSTLGAHPDIAIARFTPGGRLDPAFGDGGKVVTDLGANDYAFDVAIQDDGGIVVVGGRGTAASGRFLVQRYRPNGTLDPGFANGGTALTGFGRRLQSASAVAITPQRGDRGRGLHVERHHEPLRRGAVPPRRAPRSQLRRRRPRHDRRQPERRAVHRRRRPAGRTGRGGRMGGGVARAGVQRGALHEGRTARPDVRRGRHRPRGRYPGADRARALAQQVDGQARARGRRVRRRSRRVGTDPARAARPPGSDVRDATAGS